MPKKPKIEILFYLTDDQMEIMFPIFRERAAHRYNRRGVILLQTDTDGRVTGGFVPPKYTKRIAEIMEVYQDDLDNKKG